MRACCPIRRWQLKWLRKSNPSQIRWLHRAPERGNRSRREFESLPLPQNLDYRQCMVFRPRRNKTQPTQAGDDRTGLAHFGMTPAAISLLLCI